MSTYVFLAAGAALAYVALLIAALSVRPWQARQARLAGFLLLAVLWATYEAVRGTGALEQYGAVSNVISAPLLLWTAAQFYYFVAASFPREWRGWVPVACISPAAAVVLVLLGQVNGVPGTGAAGISSWYDAGIVLSALPVLVLLLRSAPILWERLHSVERADTRSRVIVLLGSVCLLTAATLGGVLARDAFVPVATVGHITVAFLLGYSLSEHRSIGMSPVLCSAVAWVHLGVVGAVSYWVLFLAANAVLDYEVDLRVVLLATLVSVLASVMVYNLRSFVPAIAQRALRPLRPDYFQRLNDFADRIDGSAGLRQHGSELLALANEAIGCRRAALLFPDLSATDFVVLSALPPGLENPLSQLRLGNQGLVAELLRSERRVLTRESLAPARNLAEAWQREAKEIESSKAELLVPLMGRGSLVGILALGRKRSGRYTMEDALLLEHLSDRLAAATEKGFFREQRRLLEEDLEIMNRVSILVTSSLDIESVYDSLMDEVKRVVDLSWSALSLIEGEETRFLAVRSSVPCTWEAGVRLPIRGTPAEWLTLNRKTLVEPDLRENSRFITGNQLLRYGLRSSVHIPLMTGDGVVGSLEMASRLPDAFGPRQIGILEQIARQIATQIENSRLYGEAVRMARIDELTGLENRRALNETMNREIDRCGRYGGLFSLIVLDIDSLKSVNDSYGHLVGDRFLTHVGDILGTALRSTDRAFRYGGDEFAVILPQTSADAAIEVAERIRRQMAGHDLGLEIGVSASIGVAAWPVNGLDAEALMAAADSALYEAKRLGGSRSCRAAEPVPVRRQ